MSITEQSRIFMAAALDEAAKGWGRVSPNPMVGAVVVKNGIIIGRGYHHAAGEAHAEVNAIADAGTACAGADIYVTLEPCSTFGRTPPCTKAIIEAGLKRVFTGCVDPNPEHAGNGLKILEAAGIKTESGILENKCRRLNEAFFKWITTRKPFVLLKMAMTLDGKIATASGDSCWITGAEARERVQRLRQWSDAIMVGGETARLDHPALNVRNVADWEKQPRRLIFSRSLNAAQAAKLLAPGLQPEIVSAQTPSEWNNMLEKLGSENVSALLLEGGGELAAAALDAGVVDKVEFHIAPKILGGRGSRPVVGGNNPEKLIEAVNLQEVEQFKAGADFIISGYPANTTTGDE